MKHRLLILSLSLFCCCTYANHNWTQDEVCHSSECCNALAGSNVTCDSSSTSFSTYGNQVSLGAGDTGTFKISCNGDEVKSYTSYISDTNEVSCSTAGVTTPNVTVTCTNWSDMGSVTPQTYKVGITRVYC